MSANEAVPEPKLEFFDRSKEAELKPLCQRVRKEFQIPQHSLICIFDDQERPEFSMFGESLRGLSYPTRFPLSASGLSLPFVTAYLHDSQGRKFDFLIYLTHQVCRSQNATVITFAHELKHFVQFGFDYKDYLTNDDVRSIWNEKGMNTLPWALPCEYEALLFSKKVSESLLGKNVVLDYAEEQKAEAQRKKEWKELEKWRFFLEELDVQESFDLHRQTDSIVDLNREALQAKFPNNNGDGPDYTKTNWRE